MRGGLSASAALLGLALLAACGGGGGGGGGAQTPSTPGPTPSTPPPDPGGPAALERPLSASLLCANGLVKRYAAVSADAFAAVTSARGIDHVHDVDPAVWTQQPEALETVMRSGAVLAGEVTGDCWPDLLFVTGAAASAQIVAYENRRGTGFRQQYLDLAASPNPLAAIALADLDADYRFELITGNLLAGPTRIYRRGADGQWSLAQDVAMAGSTFGLAVGDFAGDGWVDAYAAHWDVSPPALPGPGALRNTGDDPLRSTGSLIDADLETGTGQANVPAGFEVVPGFADLNGDGRLDLLIAADAGASEVLIDNGSQYFSSLTDAVNLSAVQASGAAVRDFDNDGHWDWFIASVHDPNDGRVWPWGRSGNQLYWGRADSPYLAPGGTPSGAEDAEWPWGACAEDFDNDGRVDLFVENGYGFAPEAVRAASGGHAFLAQVDQSLYDRQFSRARLFLNRGNRTFEDASAAWGIEPLSNGRGVACFDYDRDGDVDIAVAQNSGAPILYENLNAGGDGNRFLSLRLLSAAPNTYAVGAVVEIEAGGVVQMSQVGSQGGYLGQNPYELHFGLGAADVVDRITLRWPGGSTQALSDIRANRFLTLLDPRLLTYRDPARDARVGAAIVDASSYVARNPAALTDDTLSFLGMMQRLYGLSLPYSPAAEIGARILTLESAGDGDRANALRSYRRLYDAAYEIAADDFADLPGLDAITLASVYCHQFALTETDLGEVAALVDRGGYDATHALLAMLFAIDNNCTLPSSFDQSLIGDIVVAVHGIADGDDGGLATDLTIEAMTFLAAAGRHDLIEPSWVDRVLDAQEPDGGWKADPGDASSSGHTTGLALWLLFQLAEQVKVQPGLLAQAWD